MSELYTAVVNLEISEISFCGNLHTAEYLWRFSSIFYWRYDLWCTLTFTMGLSWTVTRLSKMDSKFS